jgi:Protein of unknown function (DUF2793)
MSDTSTNLGLPYLVAAQAQKHVTHNEALRLLDALVQLSVLDRDRTVPPDNPSDGDRHLVASGATGLWAGWDLNIAFWADGAWIRLVPRTGWLVWVAADQTFLLWQGSSWFPIGIAQKVSDSMFGLFNEADPSRKARFDLSGLTAGATLSYTLPDTSSELAIPAGTQTFTGDKTFSGQLAAQVFGLGGATADSWNRLSVNAPAVLFNNAGAGIEATVNKAAPANDASFAFKTNWSARALIGLLGSDDFTVKVSPDGAAYHEAIRVEGNTGRVELPEPVVLPALDAVPAAPPAGKLALYARARAGAGWLDVQRPSGRFFPLQPHFGVNRIATWAPSSSTTVNSTGMPRAAVGTVSTPGLATTNLSTSMRRWRLTSAATADSVADERANGWVCWRGNAEGLGGFTYVNRFSLATLQSTGMGFFGLYGATGALATNLTLSAVVNCIGIGFQRGTHTNWQLVQNDASGAPTLTGLGSNFPVASTTNVLTLTLVAAPNGSDIGVRIVEEVSGAVAEFTLDADIPGTAQLLSPRNYMNNGSTAAAVAFDCSGVYVETDY